MKIVIECPICHKTHCVMVNLNEYNAWAEGELIQTAMPSLTPTERESLISHLCPNCQRDIFGEE